MPTAIPAQKAPYPVDAKAGRKYFWCVSGHGAKQPFLDDIHKSL